MIPRKKLDVFAPGWKPPAPHFEDVYLSSDFHDFNAGPKEYVWDGLLALGEFSVVFGDPAAGKGNFVTTLGCAVAGGRPLFGRNAGWYKDGDWWPCGVLYFALERHEQVKRRVKAYERHHGAPYHIPFAVCQNQFDIRDESTASSIIETLYEVHGDSRMRLDGEPGVCNYQPDFNLIVIDTLSMALAGGNDSDPGDMAKAIHTIKQVIAETGVHVMVVHHSPVSGDNRMRGYGTLNAAIDVSIRVEDKKTHRVASVVKNSDTPDAPRYYFGLQSINVPHWYGDKFGDRVGEPFDVPVPLLIEMDAPPAKERPAAKEPKGAKVARPSKSEQPVYDALAGFGGPATEDDWRAAYDASPVDGVSASNHRVRFSRGKKDLAAKGLIRQGDDGKWSVTVSALQNENCNSEET